MPLLHRIMDSICHALATSGPTSWEGEFVKGEFVMDSEAQEIETGRQGAAESRSSIPLAELALISRLDETAQLGAAQPVKRVSGTVMSRTH